MFLLARMFSCNLIVTLASGLLLSACVGAPVGWGGSHTIDFQSKEKIIISYDELLEAYEDVLQVASDHCKKYGMHANPTRVQKDIGTDGYLKTYTFSCATKSADQQVKESWGRHKNTRGYQKVKKMAFYSNPSGAKIYEANSNEEYGSKFLCQTPCEITVQPDFFMENTEATIRVSAIWRSGAYHTVVLIMQRGANEHFTFQRPDVPNL